MESLSELPILLSIDVEGLDLDVLKSNNWERFKPKVIYIEDWQMTELLYRETEINAVLHSKGYNIVAFTGLSAIYVLKN